MEQFYTDLCGRRNNHDNNVRIISNSDDIQPLLAEEIRKALEKMKKKGEIAVVDQ